MKRLTCLVLVGLILILPCQRSQAPLPVVVSIAVKCFVVGAIGAGAYLIWKCEPNYYLIKVQVEGEEPYWLVSQASEATVKKNEGWMRCEGPFKTRDEADFRAWANNKHPESPMFPCGPLGTIPSPTHTNYARVTVEQSLDGGISYTYVATAMVAPGEQNFSVSVLPNTGTNGMTLDQINEVKGSDVQFIASSPLAIPRLTWEDVKDK